MGQAQPADAAAQQAAQQAEQTSADNAEIAAGADERSRAQEADDLIAGIFEGKLDSDGTPLEGEDGPETADAPEATESTPEPAQSQERATEPEQDADDEDAEPEDDEEAIPEITDEEEIKAIAAGLQPKVYQLKRLRRRVEKERQAAERERQMAEQMRQEAIQAKQYVSQLEGDIRSGNFEGAIDRLARQSGYRPEDLMDRWIAKKAGADETGGLAPDDVRRLEQKVDERFKQLEERERRLEQERAQMAYQKGVRTDIEALASFRSNPKMSRMWPNLAKLPDMLIEDWAPAIIEQAVRDNGNRQDVAAELDRRAALLFKQSPAMAMTSVQGTTEGQNPQNPGGTEPPDRTRSKPAVRGNPPPTITANDATEARRPSELTLEEREAEAARLEQEIVAGFYSDD